MMYSHTGICAVVIVAPVKATEGFGGFMPSITVSFVTKDCLSKGRLLCNSIKFFEKFRKFSINLKMFQLTFKKPTRHGCGAAFNRFSSF
jgi:hypothetical protein